MMTSYVALLVLLPVLVTCSWEGNIRLLEDEVATALKSCTSKDYINLEEAVTKERQRRSEYLYDESKIDDIKKEINQYSHERRNTTNNQEQKKVLNSTDEIYGRNGIENMGEKLLTSLPSTTLTRNSSENTSTNNRTKRSDPLFHKPDVDQCLSQCVFANLQVVDSRGIPREAELWNKVQSSVTSQQSRSALQDQIRACFQELQSETEDNGCSYSNKLERCLMLRFVDRKTNHQGTTPKTV